MGGVPPSYALPSPGVNIKIDEHRRTSQPFVEFDIHTNWKRDEQSTLTKLTKRDPCPSASARCIDTGDRWDVREQSIALVFHITNEKLISCP